MKKLYTTVGAILAIVQFSHAQVWSGNGTDLYFTAGKVGIGVSTPATKLDILGSTNFGLLQLTSSGQAADIRLRQTNAVHPFTRNWSLYTNSSQYGSFELGVSSDRYLDDYSTKFLIDRLGNVGIGTSSPYGTLNVMRSSGNGTITRFGTSLDAGQALDLNSVQSSTGNGYYSLDLSSSVPNWQKFVIPVGRVGIGTTNPSDIFQVNNGSTIRFQVGSSGGVFVNNEINGGSLSSPGPLYLNYTSTGNTLLNSNGGSVGIGTNTPDAAYKLSVNGKIRSKEIKVETTWSDYVFDKDYQLRPINEVDTYIKKNHHLPDIPSAAEVEKNGVNLGETSSLLLKKIEELTLYLIEKDKQITEIQNELKALKQKANNTTER
jgi:hypothetical protein